MYIHPCSWAEKQISAAVLVPCKLDIVLYPVSHRGDQVNTCMGGWLDGSNYQELLEVLGNSPLIYMPTRRTGEMFDSYHYASSGRKTMARKKGKFTLFFPLSSLSHSLNLFLDDRGGNDARKEKMTSVR
jgi:Zn-finger nucleic acid-binding protein